MYQGVIYALAAAALFGISVPLAKLFTGVASPMMLAGLLYAGSGVGLALALAAQRSSLAWVTQRSSDAAPAESLPRRDEWRWLAAAIFFGGVAGPAALMFGLVTTAASSASLLLNLETVFTALLAWFLFHENVDGRVAAGVLAILAGSVVLAWAPDASFPGLAGPLLIVVACLCWALDNNVTRKVAGRDPVAIAALKGLVAGAVNLGMALLVLGDKLPSIGVVLSAAAVGVLGYGVSLVLFVLALRHLGSARTAAYFSVAPFFGAVTALLVQREPVTLQLIVAGALMGLGVWLHLTERHAHLHEHEAMEHSHSHSHDEHHRHAHDDRDPQEPHTHGHVHAPMVHGHVHFPDMHHRHRHRHPHRGGRRRDAAV